MKFVVIILILLLTSGAFLSLMLEDSTGVTAALHGDERLQWMWLVIDFAVVIICFFHGRQFIRVASQQPLVLAFIVWGVLSLAWSGDPQLTVRRTVGLVCSTAFGFFLGMRFEMRTLLRMLAFTLVIAILASVAAAILFPSFGVMAGVDGGWRGVYVHKNVMARVMGLAVVVFLCLIWDAGWDRLKYVIPLILAVVLIVLSKSMTAVVVTVLTLSLGFFRRLRLRPAQIVALLAFVMLLGLAATLYLQGHTDTLFAWMGRDSTLTGRTTLWQIAGAAVLKRPLLGAGWDVFWASSDGDNIRNLIGWQAPHAHNAFLDISLNVGLIGLAIFLAALFDCFRRAVRYSRELGRPFSLWPLLFFSYMFFYMFTETTQVDRHSLFYIIYCAVSVSMNLAPRSEFLEDELEEEYMPMGMASSINTYPGLR
jgi:O-antigen ligase